MKNKLLILKYVKFSNIIDCLEELNNILKEKRIQNRKKLITSVNNCVIDAISEISLNCLKNKFPLEKTAYNKLFRHREALRKLSNKKLSNKIRRKILIQKGGFLPLLIEPALSFIGAIVVEYLSNQIKK